MTTPGPAQLVVIGGGPAGVAAAVAARRAGLDHVVLMERRNDQAASPGAPKVCGGCVNAAAIERLEALGLTDALHGAVPLRTVQLVAGRRSARLAMGGVAIGRDVLDPALRSAARRQGVAVITGVQARVAGGGGQGPAMPARPVVRWTGAGGPRDGAAQSLEADVVIAADGLSGGARDRPTGVDGDRGPARTVPRRERVGIGTVLSATPSSAAPAVPWPPAGELVMSVSRGGYLGLVQVDGERVDVAAAVAPDRLAAAGGPRAWLISAIEALGRDGRAPAASISELVRRMAEARLGGTPRLGTQARRAVEGSVLRVGDALAYTEPFTGEGMGWAMVAGAEAGRLAAGAIAAGEVNELATRWMSRTRRSGRSRRWSRVVAGLAASPRATGVIIEVLRLRPRSVRGLMRAVHREPALRPPGGAPSVPFGSHS